MPKPLAKPSFLELMADQRDLNKIGPRAKAQKTPGSASSQVATIGKAASTSLITGIAAEAAEQLGANGQRMDPLRPLTDSTESDIRQIFLTFFLGIIVGMFLLRYLQTSSISGTLHRLSGYFRYIWRFTYFLCRTLSLCTCNCTCWFRRHQNSIDRIYDRMQNKGKGKGKRQRFSLSTSLASAREFAQSTKSFMAFVKTRRLPVMGHRPELQTLHHVETVLVPHPLRLHQAMKHHLLDGLASFMFSSTFKCVCHIFPFMLYEPFVTCLFQHRRQ